MQQHQVYCLSHPNSLVTHICIGVHQCQKKLCSDCQYQHQELIQGNLIIPFSILKEQLQEKIEQFQLNDTIRLNRAKQEFKYAISKMQQTFSTLIDEMNESSEQIFQEIEKVDQQLLDLLSQNILDSSNSDLQKISQILKLNQLELWQQQKQYCYQILDENKQSMMNIGEQIAANLRERIKTTYSEKIGLDIFENSILFGISHDEFICINNEIISKQGIMKLNERRGLIETLGFSLEENKLKAIQIEFQQGQICYIADGKILRSESFNQLSSTKEIITNYDQLLKLKWKTEETQYQAFWEEEKLELGGQYNQKGRKQGFWIEPCSNYSIQLQVIYEGFYSKKGKKQGNWKLIKKNKTQFDTIGGGNYNEFGEKQGQWMELNDEVLPQQNQVIVNCGYYKGGYKIGSWKNYQYKESLFTKNKLIGGGEFQKGIKNGKWIEIHYSFIKAFQVTFVGIYNYGLKIGKWNIYLKKNNEENVIIGGGSYNDFGQKNGNWNELNNYFHQFHFITCCGAYKNGKKYGKWIIQNTINNQDAIIGGGEYDQQGLKNGDWIDIFQNYAKYNNKLYEIFGNNFQREIFKWIETRIMGNYLQQQLNVQWNFNTISGGGSYDKDGEKCGKWTEVHENFSQQKCNVLFVGDYKYGRRIGEWQMIIQKQGELKQLICGIYEQNGLKIGKWIELNDHFEQEVIEYSDDPQKQYSKLYSEISI